MKKLAAILIFFLAEISTAAIVISMEGAIKIVDEGCGLAIAHFDSHFSYAPQIIASLAAKRPQSADYIRDYFAREQAKGRNPVYIGADMTLLFQWFDQATSDEMDALFVRADSKMKAIRQKKATSPTYAFSIEEVGIVSRDPIVSRTLERFGTLGIPLVLAEQEPFAKAASSGYPADLMEGQFPTRERAVNFAGSEVVAILSKYGMETRDGLFFANAMNNVLFPESVVHEVAHAVQNRLWDYKILARFYQAHIKARFDSTPAFRKPSPRLVKLHYSVQKRLFTNRVGEKHAKDFFTEWDALGLSEADFVVLAYIFCLLAEIDAHYQQGLHAAENGLDIPSHTVRVFDHVKRTYVGEDRPILPLPYELAVAGGEEPLRALIRQLNDSIRVDSP